MERNERDLCIFLWVGLRHRRVWFAHRSYPVSPQVAVVSSFLVVLMACTTLSFLITTPEAWVSGPGTAVRGFPFLALPGLLVVKDSIMLGAAILTMADSAKVYLKRIGVTFSFLKGACPDHGCKSSNGPGKRQPTGDGVAE